MHRIVSLFFVLVLTAGAWAQNIGQGSDTPSKEDPVKKALEDFGKMYKEGNQKKDESVRSQALHILDPFLTDQRVVDAISKVLNTASEADAVKTTAVQQLGGSGNVKILPTLEKAFNANEKNNCAQEIVNQIGHIQDKATVKSLEKIIRPRVNKFDDAKAGNIARAGINALGTLKFLESLDLLMKLLDTVQQGKPEKDATIPPEEQAKEGERTNTTASITGSMIALTGKSEISTPEDWKKWWKDNKKSWKFPQ